MEDGYHTDIKKVKKEQYLFFSNVGNNEAQLFTLTADGQGVSSKKKITTDQKKKKVCTIWGQFITSSTNIY